VARGTGRPARLRLLLDEMFSPLIARELRSLGHDVIAIAERPEWYGYSDPQVLELARRERRAIVTNNVNDFRRLHNAEVVPGAGGHFGMLFAPGSYARTRANTGAIVATLAARLTSLPGDEDLANGVGWL
jgi:hypothetical protein